MALRSFGEVLWRGDCHALVLLLSLQSVLVGLWLLQPTWETFVAAPIYAGLALIASEGWWGLWFLSLGLLFWPSLYARPVLGQAIAFALAVTWYGVAASYAYGNVASFGIPLVLASGMGASWVFLRLRLQRCW